MPTTPHRLQRSSHPAHTRRAHCTLQDPPHGPVVRRSASQISSPLTRQNSACSGERRHPAHALGARRSQAMFPGTVPGAEDAISSSRAPTRSLVPNGRAALDPIIATGHPSIAVPARPNNRPKTCARVPPQLAAPEPRQDRCAACAQAACCCCYHTSSSSGRPGVSIRYNQAPSERPTAAQHLTPPHTLSHESHSNTFRRTCARATSREYTQQSIISRRFHNLQPAPLQRDAARQRRTVIETPIRTTALLRTGSPSLCVRQLLPPHRCPFSGRSPRRGA